MSSREVVESPLRQGADEKVTYTLDTSNWASSPTSPSIKVYDEDGTDVTSTVTTGSPSAAGDVITLPPIHDLTAGKKYTVEVQFTAGAYAPAEAYAYINAET